MKFVKIADFEQLNLKFVCNLYETCSAVQPLLSMCIHSSSEALTFGLTYLITGASCNYF